MSGYLVKTKWTIKLVTQIGEEVVDEYNCRCDALMALVGLISLNPKADYKLVETDYCEM